MKIPSIIHGYLPAGAGWFQATDFCELS
jgi:hypothetical protein